MPRLELVVSPHLAENDHLPEILQNLTDTFATCPTVDSEAIKTYLSTPTLALTGQNAPPGFVHLTVHILSGRSLEIRKQISEKMAGRLAQAFNHSLTTKQIGITVDVREMDRDTFTKLL